MKIIIKTKSKPPSMMYRKTISSLVCVCGPTLQNIVPTVTYQIKLPHWDDKDFLSFLLLLSTVQGGQNTMWKITHLALNKTLSKLGGLP